MASRKLARRMYLKSLQVKQVRNLSEVHLSPCPRLNFLFGKNASGKTALLESIYLLSRARSFRTPRIMEVIQHFSGSLQVTARVWNETLGDLNTGLKKGYGKVTVRYNGEPVNSVSIQARNLPLVLITPDSHTLITGGPQQRRHWLDWSMFHVEQDYLRQWNIYIKAMRQRNALFKRNIKNRQLYVGWEQEMVKSACYLAEVRAVFLDELMKEISALSEQFFSGKVLFELYPGWPVCQEFEKVLSDNWDADLRTGHTRFGPHRADLKITFENKALSSFFSRGQIRILTYLMILSQARVLTRKTGIKPLALIDDYHAELDTDVCKRLLTLLVNEELQCFLTATQHNLTGLDKDLYKVFHVEQGHISEDNHY